MILIKNYSGWRKYNDRHNYYLKISKKLNKNCFAKYFTNILLNFIKVFLNIKKIKTVKSEPVCDKTLFQKIN